MAKNCKICGFPTIFYIWSTSRYFNRKEFINVLKRNEKKDRISLEYDGEPICQACVNKYGLMNR